MNEYKKSDMVTVSEGFFPPPWNIYDHPEKTEGWIAFQEYLSNNHKYYCECCNKQKT